MYIGNNERHVLHPYTVISVYEMLLRHNPDIIVQKVLNTRMVYWNGQLYDVVSTERWCTRIETLLEILTEGCDPGIETCFMR